MRTLLLSVNINAPLMVTRFVSEQWDSADMRMPISSSLIGQHHGNLVEQKTPFISAMGRQRQVESIKFKASLVSSKSGRLYSKILSQKKKP